MQNDANQADLRLVTTRERGAAIRRRRMEMGITSARKFGDLVGKDERTVAKVEKGEGTEQSTALLETWLDRRERETAGDGPRDEVHHAAVEAVSIKMSGIYGIDDVVISGPIDHIDDLKRLAVDLLREVRGED